jgi:hypothetical protein
MAIRLGLLWFVAQIIFFGLAAVFKESPRSISDPDTERPIESAAEDEYQRGPLVRRIVESLLRGQSVAILGDYGSGKSSVVNLAREEFRKRELSKIIWTCPVSCWGFTSPNDAIAHILHEVIGEISRHVDTRSLSGLPESYISAVSGISTNVGSVLSRLIPVSKNPYDQLHRLRFILSAAGAVLIIAIEDLDRNPSATFNSGDVQAMLQRVKMLVPQVRFIVATTATDKILLIKLCEHLEELNPPSARVVYDALEQVRSVSLSLHPSDVEPESNRSELWRKRTESDWFVFESQRDRLEDAGAFLCRNPRALRRVKRSHC